MSRTCEPPDWELRPQAGWAEFRAARARFLAQLARETEIARMERAFREAPSGGDGRARAGWEGQRPPEAAGVRPPPANAARTSP